MNSTSSSASDQPTTADNVAKTSAYNHVMKSTGLLGAVQIFYILMSVVRNKLTALLIGTAGIGMADLYCRTLELLGNTTNFGIAFSAVRRLASLYEEGRPHETAFYVRLVRTWTFLTALFGAGLCLALSPLISQWITNSYDAIVPCCLLAPAVAFTTLAGGEIAILKGMRRLKHLALVSAAGALGTVALTIPTYALWGLLGVLPVIIMTTALTFFLNLAASSRLFPYRISPFRKKFICQGGHMIRLGLAYVAAGIAGATAELFIRTTVVESDSSFHQAGLYAAGLTLTVSYARLIFVAMDADYFPRLSAAVKDPLRANATINQQTDILVLLMAPFLIAFAICLEWIIPMLYTQDFMGVVPMVLCALPYMFFKAIYSPIAYLPLAAGRSRLYLFAELIYDAAFAFLVTVGYKAGGLVGAGIGLSVANMVDLIVLPQLYGRLFHFRFATATLHRCLQQGSLLLMALAACSLPYFWGKLIALLFLAISSATAFRFLQHETTVATKFKNILHRFKKKS